MDLEPLAHGSDRGNIDAGHRRPEAASVGHHDQRKGMHVRGQNQAGAHQHGADGNNRTRSVMVGQLSREGRKEEGQAGDGGEEQGHGGVIGVELQRHGFEKNSEGVSDAEADERTEEGGKGDHPGTGRIESGI